MVEHEAVVEALRGVHDPEIPVNVYDLGLVYPQSAKKARSSPQAPCLRVRRIGP